MVAPNSGNWFQSWGPPSFITDQQPIYSPLPLRNVSSPSNYDFNYQPLVQIKSLKYSYLEVIMIFYFWYDIAGGIALFYYIIANVDPHYMSAVYLNIAEGITEGLTLCIFGQHLINQSVSYYETLCECPWYNWNGKNRSLYVMMLIHAQRPIKISAYGLIDLHLPLLLTGVQKVLNKIVSLALHSTPMGYGSPAYGPNSLLTYMLALSVAKPKPRYYTGSEGIRIETTGPFKTWYYWKTLDFAYPTEEDRQIAILKEEFIPKNNLPLGVEVFKHRIFVSMPKWKPGVPATLAVIPRIPRESSPNLVPYPNWDWHRTDTCESITSVFRVAADTCGRLWVLDSGLINVTIKPKQICPPKILVFDLKTDELLFKHVLPDEFIKEDSLYSNIIVDVRHDCENVHAYLADVWRFGIVVFSLARMKSWRITDHLFFPEPLASAYKVHNLNFEWTDGIFGMALSPYSRYETDRILYFHPMSSFREFYVKTSVICNETGWSEIKNAFRVMGQSRGKSGHVSASRIDRNGIMFYNLVTRDSVGCWDSRKPYKRSNLGLVAQDEETLVFPNDLKIDQEKRQSVWVLSNKLPFYLYEGLDHDKINFRVLSAYVDEAVKNTICDPKITGYDTFVDYQGEDDCY